MQVTILTSRHVTDYKTSESTSSLHSPFLKALKTQNSKEPPCCSLLEQPNIVHDLPAAGGIKVRNLYITSWYCFIGSYYFECERCFWSSLLMINNALLFNLSICSCQSILFGLNFKVFHTQFHENSSEFLTVTLQSCSVPWSLVTPVSQC